MSVSVVEKVSERLSSRGVSTILWYLESVPHSVVQTAMNAVVSKGFGHVDRSGLLSDKNLFADFMSDIGVLPGMVDDVVSDIFRQMREMDKPTYGYERHLDEIREIVRDDVVHSAIDRLNHELDLCDRFGMLVKSQSLSHKRFGEEIGVMKMTVWRWINKIHPVPKGAFAYAVARSLLDEPTRIRMSAEMAELFPKKRRKASQK